MLKTLKYRLYPDTMQAQLLAEHFGSVRLVYNLALEAKQSAYKGGISISYHDLRVQLVDLKQEYRFLKKVNSQSLQSAIRNIDTAYKNFFRGCGFPKFKSRSSKQSFQCPQNVRIDFRNGLIHLPKFKSGIKIILHRSFGGEIKTVTISKTPSGKYFASVLIDNKKPLPDKKEVKNNTAIGIDLGLASYITLSDGTKYENPKFLRKSISSLKRAQKQLSRKRKGSNRREEQRLKVARLYGKVTNQRNDFLHKASNEIANRFDTICTEDLGISNMMKNHRLAQSIGDASWSRFIEFLRYKCEWRGKNLIQVDRFAPTTKMCHCCGNKQHLSLKDREWQCAICGTAHDRDINAAINIKVIALEYWRAEHPRQDAEVVDCHTIEASKVQDNILLDFPSQSF